jgi:asparagine synthase (glutamine-hydrolysing)
MLGVPRELAEPAAPKMLAAMRHRGPDDYGMVILPAPNNARPPVVLLHARLSILDLTQAGHQPMADQPRLPSAKPNWVVFNGEIFNFLLSGPGATGTSDGASVCLGKRPQQ